jgi:hypothetical protein
MNIHPPPQKKQKITPEFYSTTSKTFRILFCRDGQIFEKSRTHFKILVARMVTRSKFHTEGHKY